MIRFSPPGANQLLFCPHYFISPPAVVAWRAHFTLDPLPEAPRFALRSYTISICSISKLIGHPAVSRTTPLDGGEGGGAGRFCVCDRIIESPFRGFFLTRRPSISSRHIRPVHTYNKARTVDNSVVLFGRWRERTRKWKITDSGSSVA